MKWVFLTLIAATAALTTIPRAEAAALCMRVTGVPLQCLYDDPAVCQRESGRQGGECAINPAAPLISTSSSTFCVVDASLVANCIYPDKASCNADATRREGACVANLVQLLPQEDPYKEKRPY